LEEPRWVPRVVVEAVHHQQLGEDGGLRGLRDEGALESALARPRNLWAHEEAVDLADLAAAYGFGLCRNHPFHDGNKRVAFVTMVIFLGLNGLEFTGEEDEVTAMIRVLAGGDIEEKELGSWIRLRSRSSS